MTNEQIQDNEPPKIQIDDDWKAEAKAEKERLSAAEKKVEEKVQSRQMPEANFRGLLGILASQALMGLGMHQDPSGKGVMVDLEGAKFAIDLLEVINKKTEGNLTDEEGAEIKQLLQELQARFVQIAELVTSQMQNGGATTESGQSSEPASGGIIDPTT